MLKVIPIRVDENLEFLVEVASEPDVAVETRSTPRTDLPPGATPTGRVADTMATMSKTVVAVVKFVREGFVLANHPDELAIEFSVTLKGSSGIPVVASGSTEGTFKISAKWKNQSEGPP